MEGVGISPEGEPGVVVGVSGYLKEERSCWNFSPFEIGLDRIVRTRSTQESKDESVFNGMGSKGR